MAQDQKNFKVENLFGVKDWVAVVTGGGTGIGLMAAQALANNGAKVCEWSQHPRSPVATVLTHDNQTLPDVAKRSSTAPLKFGASLLRTRPGSLYR